MQRPCPSVSSGSFGLRWWMSTASSSSPTILSLPTFVGWSSDPFWTFVSWLDSSRKSSQMSMKWRLGRYVQWFCSAIYSYVSFALVLNETERRQSWADSMLSHSSSRPLSVILTSCWSSTFRLIIWIKTSIKVVNGCLLGNPPNPLPSFSWPQASGISIIMMVW